MLSPPPDQVSVARTIEIGAVVVFFLHFFFLAECAFFFLHFFLAATAEPPEALALAPTVATISAIMATSAKPISPLFVRILKPLSVVALTLPQACAPI